MMMDLTIREIDAYAKGCDHARRTAMATDLWAAWNTALFVGHAFAGKRLPKLEPRIDGIMGHKQKSELSKVIEKMRIAAEKAGLPPPKPRMH